jgi:hypothetical protein
MKRKTSRAEKRARKKADKLASINKPSGKSKYGLKNRPKEIARGHSNRPTSPFYLAPAQVIAAGGTLEEDDT